MVHSNGITPLNEFLIGIDPGRHTGLCVYNRQSKKITLVDTKDFWGTILFVQMLKEKFTVIIEDPQLNQPVFTREANKSAMLKIAQDVGRNKEQAYLLITYFQINKIPFRTIRPVESKWSAIYLRKLTGYSARTNEHERDAIRLVYGL
jgi:hypothetical protein